MYCRLAIIANIHVIIMLKVVFTQELARDIQLYAHQFMEFGRVSSVNKPSSEIRV